MSLLSESMLLSECCSWRGVTAEIAAAHHGAQHDDCQTLGDMLLLRDWVLFRQPAIPGLQRKHTAVMSLQHTTVLSMTTGVC